MANPITDLAEIVNHFSKNTDEKGWKNQWSFKIRAREIV